MSDASDLATLFFQWSQAVDEFRGNNAPTLTSDQKVRLKDFAGQLDDISTHFTLADIASTIASIQPQINQIKTVTANAKNTLRKLKTTAQIVSAVAAVVAIGVSVEGGNVGGVLAGIGDLAKAVSPPTTGS
jgi:signal recognition particle GTPase